MCSDTFVIPTDELSFPLIADGVTLDTLEGVMSRAFFTLDGTNGQGLTVADSAAVSITGDIDIRWLGSLDDWTPLGDSRGMVEKWGSGGNSYIYRINTGNGRPVLFWGGLSIGALTAPTIGDGDPIGLRVTLDVDNGAGGRTLSTYTKPFASIAAGELASDSGWTLLETPITQAGTTSIPDNTAPVAIGNRFTTDDDLLEGTVYEVVIKDGINGTLALHIVAEDYSGTGSTFTERANGATVTINGSMTYTPVGARGLIGRFTDDGTFTEYGPWVPR
jgi:hypothetical protein